MQMRASASLNDIGRAGTGGSLAWPDASGNCISWLSRALRTFARTLTMDSHAGCGEELGFGRYCFQAPHSVHLAFMSASGLDLAPARAGNFKFFEVGGWPQRGHCKRSGLGSEVRDH